MKYKLTAFSFALFAAAIMVAPASADQIFNGSLVEGVYFGTGNPNSGFTENVSYNSAFGGSELELGLEAIQRFVGPITPSDNDYPTLPGQQIDIAFSVDVNANNVAGGATLGNYIYSLSLTDDVTGQSVTFSPTLLPDNAQIGVAPCTGSGCAYNPANTGMQNAEYLGFSFIAGPLGYNPADPITATLSAIPLDGLNVDPSVTINIIPQNTAATPEPASAGLAFGGLALGGIIFARRRKRV